MQENSACQENLTTENTESTEMGRGENKGTRFET